MRSPSFVVFVAGDTRSVARGGPSAATNNRLDS